MNSILNLLATDDEVILYRKELNKITNSVTSTILLQQIIFRNKISKGNSFYKFIVPCGHPKYKDGDSWTEELGFSKKEFATAFKKLEVLNIVSKKITRDRVTYYTLHTEVLEPLLVEVYSNSDMESTQSTKEDLPKLQMELTKSTERNLDTITEKTTEKTTDIKKNKQKKETPPVEAKSKKAPEPKEDLSKLYEAHSLKNDIADFVEHRKEMKKPFTKIGLNRFINLVDDCANSGFNVIELMNNSIAGGYPTIYKPKQNKAVQPKYVSKEQMTRDTIARVSEMKQQWRNQNVQ